MFIRPLPDEAIQQLKSSVAITSLNDAVIGLAKNSLDASATRINISVDYSRGNCSVEDDGHGIQPNEFLEGGALARPHCTSRYPPSDDFHGSHGSFLSSLATLSLVSVTSQHHAHESANTVTIRNSAVLSRNLPSLAEHQLHYSGHGTRVTVMDLFGSMAVRVKQRPAASDKVAMERDFGHLILAAVALILAWPKLVSLSLRDSQGHSEIRLRPPRSHSPADLKLSTRVARILVQSGLADEISYGTWVSAGASSDSITVSGCISLNAVATRRVQFLSMGIRPFTNQHSKNVLYDEINQVFASSDFASADDTGNLRDKEPYAPRELRAKKRLERWPMFYLRIDRSSKGDAAMSSAEDVLDQPRTLSVIIDLVKTISVEFLRKHHFRPRTTVDTISPLENETQGTSTAGQNSAVNSSSKPGSRSSTPKLRPESPFDSWQRVKVGRRADASSKRRLDCKAADPPTAQEASKTLEAGASTEGTSTQPLISRSGKLLRRPFGNVEWPSSTQPTPDIPSSKLTEQAPSSATPTSREQSMTSASNTSLTLRPSASSEPNFRCIQPGETPSAAEPSDWLKDILASWDNPAFEATESRIPSIEGAIAAGGLGTGCAGHHSTDDPNVASATITHRGRMSKKSLSQAEVISQVDQKFILIKTCQQTSSGDTSQQANSSLVIVDQHAADERCQLEELMRSYFEVDSDGNLGAKTERLAYPVRFEFSARECDMLRRCASHFEHWGILLGASPLADGGHTGMVDVAGLPPSILERARSEPKLLADLLRGEMWRLEEDGPPRSTHLGRNVADWVTNFQGCPQGILDMLNSRSCRSAIMFNDVLSDDQCRDLITRLSKCSFPFQCAHGRPSMAPLIDLDGFGSMSRGYTGGEEVGFGKKMRELGWEAQE